MTDARLLLGSAIAVPAAFVTLVLLPAGDQGFTLPMDLDVLVGLGGLLTLVLGPFVCGVAGWATLVALCGWRDLPSAERRMLLVTVALLLGFLAVLMSERSEDAISWWLD